MSNTHGQISRLGVNLQCGYPFVGFPNWGADVYATRFGSTALWAADAMSAAYGSTPDWMGNFPTGLLVTSREYLHALGRYPGRVKETWRYQCSLTGINGRSTRIACTVWAAEVCRASHQGIDNSYMRSGIVTVEYLRVFFTDGGSTDYYAGAVLFNYINGWGGYDQIWKWTVDLSCNRPISYATLSLAVYFGAESYHDVNDRGAPAIWTPQGIIGSTAFNVGYNFAVPADPGTGWIDRQNEYLLSYIPSQVVGLQPHSSVGTSGYTVRIA